MRFDYFEKLSKKQADAFLRRFLETESLHIKGTAKQCAIEGVKIDYSIKSISPFLQWVLKRMKTVPLKPDPGVPEWIRNTDSYTRNLFEFDSWSNKLVLQAAYYSGNLL